MVDKNIDTSKMTTEELRQALEAIQAENNALKHNKARGVTFRVSDKGALSVYGLGRFPVTLYASQWDIFLGEDNIKALRAFFEANRDKMKEKPTPRKTDEEKLADQQPVTAQVKSA